MPSGFPASVVAVVAVFATTWAAHVAHAERRQVAIISLSTDADATELAHELYATLQDHSDLQPLRRGDPVLDASLNAALQGTFEDEDSVYLQVARQARADADSALGLAQPNFGKAAGDAKRGTDALAQAAPTNAEVKQLYADLLFDQGIAQLGQGKAIDASRTFALVRRLDPQRTVDRAKYLPEIADAYDATATMHVAKSPLTVKGAGTVWIDGTSYDAAPHKEMVDDGLHLVQLTGPDREPRGEQVVVPQTTELEVAPAPASLELLVQRARKELFDAKDSVTRASAVKKVAALLSVGDAVIISKSPGGALLIQTWRDNEQGFSAIREHATEKPLELLTPLAPPRPKEPEKPPHVREQEHPLVLEKPWYRKTWVQASAGTGLVALIVTAILIARSDRMVDFDDNIQQAAK
jgi:hypothetical protein